MVWDFQLKFCGIVLRPWILTFSWVGVLYHIKVLITHSRHNHVLSGSHEKFSIRQLIMIFFLTTKSSSLKYRKTERKNYTPRRKMRVIIDAYLTAKLRYIMLRCTVLCWSANYRVETLITFSSLFRNKEISYLVMMEKNRHEIFVLMRTSRRCLRIICSARLKENQNLFKIPSCFI